MCIKFHSNQGIKALGNEVYTVPTAYVKII